MIQSNPAVHILTSNTHLIKSLLLRTPNYAQRIQVSIYISPRILDRTKDEEGRDCDRNMFRCENGPCILNSLRCNGIVDCPFDTSDELDCRKCFYRN